MFFFLENVEPKSPGVMDFLTEVVIKPKMEINNKTNSLANTVTEKNESTVFNAEKLKSFMPYSQHEIEENLQKFTKLKQNVLCRLIPASKLSFVDEIKKHCKYFNVFVSKDTLPKSWLNDDSIIFCSLKLLTFDLSEKVIYVKLCVLEDILGKPCSNLVGNIFASNIVFEQFDCQLGCRVILNYIKDKPVVNEINICTKKNYLLNVEEKFKSYLIKNCDDIIVLNPDILLNIGDYIKCSVKFLPAEAKFCIADKDFVKNCKFLVNEGAILPKENAKSLVNCNTFLENISNYQNIFNKVLSVYSLAENNWENMLIIGA